MGMSKSNTPDVCTVEGCGRQVRARGLCQTHYKQIRKEGRLRPIKPKRAPRFHTQRFSGLSLSPQAVAALSRETLRRKAAPNALVTDILEEWAKRVSVKTRVSSKARRKRGGGSMTSP